MYRPSSDTEAEVDFMIAIYWSPPPPPILDTSIKSPSVRSQNSKQSARLVTQRGAAGC